MQNKEQRGNGSDKSYDKLWQSSSDSKGSDKLFNFSTRNTANTASMFAGFGKTAEFNFWSDQSSDKQKPVMSRFFSTKEEAEPEPLISDFDCNMRSRKSSQHSSSMLSESATSSVLDPLVLQTEEEKGSAFPYISSVTLSSILKDHVDGRNRLLVSKKQPQKLISKEEALTHAQELLDLLQEDSPYGNICTSTKIHARPSLVKNVVEESADNGTIYKLVVVDCRYYYEYAGGHIRSAINISSPTVMAHLLKECCDLMFNEEFLDGLLSLNDREISVDDLKQLATLIYKKQSPPDSPQQPALRRRSQTLGCLPDKIKNNKSFLASNTDIEAMDTPQVIPVLVLHCEFSSQRGPKMFGHVRSIDRQQNDYPILSFPQLFILKGGYESFFDDNGELCEPAFGYRPMLDREYRDTMCNEEARLAEEWKQLKSLGRCYKR